ncbi:MAG: hypothetical protein LBK73_06680 [Treponema sp.]|nr:hypothetical protein [Treponema sp.]
MPNTGAVTVGKWLEKLTRAGAHPRAAQLIRKGFPYSPCAIDLYRRIYRAYLGRDPLTSRLSRRICADIFLAGLRRSEIVARPFPVTRWFKITEWN